MGCGISNLRSKSYKKKIERTFIDFKRKKRNRVKRAIRKSLSVILEVPLDREMSLSIGN